MKQLESADILDKIYDKKLYIGRLKINNKA